MTTQHQPPNYQREASYLLYLLTTIYIPPPVLVDWALIRRGAPYTWEERIAQRKINTAIVCGEYPTEEVV